MQISFFLYSRKLFYTVFCLIMAVLATSTARAGSPMVKTQVPGYFRMMLGEFEITALSDGIIELGTSLFHNSSEADIQKRLESMFISAPKMKTSVNAYLINTGSRLILVDAGAGKVFGPTLGNVVQNLKASGYDPSQVDAVLITHMHGDHIGGLLDTGGKPVFPNATIYVSKAENDFNFSADTSARASYKLMLQKLAAPYIASGKWKTFDGVSLPFKGVEAVAIPGHTAGHSAFEVMSGGHSLLILGDLVHCMALQFNNPGISVDFDLDQNQAISARKGIFKNVSDKKIPVTGMHLPFPGIGMVRADGADTYTWIPVEYSPVP